MSADFCATVQEVMQRKLRLLNAESRSRSVGPVARTGRPREFDREQTLKRALELFWSRGYGATSIHDLVGALGVERGSLYGAFGDKRRFYLEAVRLYWEVYERHLVTALDTSPLLPALREILTHPARLDELISDMGVPQAAWSATRPPNSSPRTAKPRRSSPVRTAASPASSPTHSAAHSRRRVADTRSPEAQAQLLLYVVQGLSLVSRAGLDRAAALAAIDTAVDGLRA